MTPEPNPYKTLDRILKLRPPALRRVLRVVVRCEAGKCSPVRVFAVRDGLLVQCRSDADVRDMKDRYPHLSDWSRRRAFFLEEWTTSAPDQPLQVVCDCQQTKPRSVDVVKLQSLVPNDATTRNVSLRDVSP